MASDPILYGGMTAAELEFQYNFRERVPEHVDHIARWEAESARVRAAVAGSCDLAYGPHARHRLDLFPAGPEAPLFAFIHGGYWRALWKDSFSFLAPPFLRAGVSVAVIGYPLCPEVTIRQIADGVRAAVLWLKANAAAHGVSADRLVIGGHSAGGHLAAAMASADWGGPAPLAAAVGISGIYDLEPLRFVSVNESLRLDAESARADSPHHMVPSGSAPPLLLAAGEYETPEVHRQQADYAARRRAAGHNADTLTVPATDHFTVLDRLADADDPFFREVSSRLLPPA